MTYFILFHFLALLIMLLLSPGKLLMSFYSVILDPSMLLVF